MPSLAYQSTAQPSRPRSRSAPRPIDSAPKRTERECLWRISDVARYLGVPTSTIYKMTAPRSSNPIPHLKLGRLLRFRREDIDSWLACWTVNPVTDLARARAWAQQQD